jgi:gluconate 2-dehydrogenase gamma chain
MKQSVPPNSEAVNDGDQRPKEKPIAVSRRGFLRAAGLAAVSAASVGTLNGCETAPEATTPAAAPSMAELQPVAPYPPAEPPSLGTLQFFNLHEAQMVEALTARILPGTPEDPGAREVGVVYYIDNLLAHPDGFVEPTYHRPPFAQTYQGDEPPANAAGDYQIIWVPEAEIERYGYQAIFTPRETFRMGLAAIDRYARAQFEHDFAALSEEQQDQVITALVDGTATGFEPLSPKAFFQVLRRYTGEGMFSDPAYGGNRNLVGWKLLGYPGAQRAYLPDEVRQPGSGLARPIWSLADMPHFHAGLEAGNNAILPVSGSDGDHGHAATE